MIISNHFLKINRSLTRNIYQGPLNRVGTSALAAFSLRRLHLAHTGPLVKVLRSSDNGEADISFTRNNVLDIGALRAHIFSGTTALLGNVTGYAATNLTATANALAGQLTLIENAANTSYRASKALTGAMVAGTQYTVAAVVRRTGPTARDVWIELYSGVLAVQIAFRLDGLTTQIINTAGSTGVSASVSLLSEGVWLCTATFTPTAAHSGITAYISIIAKGTGDTRNYQGDGASGLILGTPGVYVTSTQLNGFIKTWYDQFVPGRSVTQATPANQPRIVSAGVVNTNNGRPSILFSGSQWLRANFSLVSVSNPLTVNAVLTPHTGGASGGYFGESTFHSGFFMQANRVGPALYFGGTGFQPTPGANIVTNPNFNIDANWVKGRGVTISGGKANAVFAAHIITQNIPLTVGSVYAFSVDYTITGGSKLRVMNSLADGTAIFMTSGVLSGSGTLSGSFTAARDGIVIAADTAEYTGTLDNVSVRTTTYAANALVVVTATRASGNGEILVNGYSLGTTTVAGSGAIGVFDIGRWGNGAETFSGNISEIIVTNSVMSTPDRQTLEREIGAYYGIAVA